MRRLALAVRDVRDISSVLLPSNTVSLIMVTTKEVSVMPAEIVRGEDEATTKSAPSKGDNKEI